MTKEFSHRLALERTATRHGSFDDHMRQDTVVADASALPVAVAQLTSEVIQQEIF